MYNAKVNANVNCGLGVIIMCHMSGNKYASMVRDIGNGGGCVSVGMGRHLYLTFNVFVNLTWLFKIMSKYEDKVIIIGTQYMNVL